MTDTVPVPDAQLDANCADGASMSGDAPKPDTHDPLPIQRWECYDPHEIGMLDDGEYVTYVDHVAAVAAARAEIVTVDFDGGYTAGYRAGLIEGDTKGRREGKRIAEQNLMQRARSAAPAPLTLAELEALPVFSVVIDSNNYAWQLGGGGWWWARAVQAPAADLPISGPVRLLHRGQGE